MPDYRSKVPLYVFPAALAEQEAALRGHPMVERLAEARAALAGDRHRPIYHYVNPEGGLNDPNGLCFWQGRWHLFYQGYPPEDPRQHWGHAVSDDLMRWRDLPYCIYPHPEECCFSGATLVEADRVVAMYHGTKAGNMVAVSSDPLLLNWRKVGDAPVIPIAAPDGGSLPYRVFDPCIWRQGGSYYSLSAGPASRRPGRHAGGCGLPVPLQGLGALGVPASVRRRRPLHARGRRRRLPLLLAHRRQAHAALLQPHERRPVPARRLRHRATEVLRHQRRQVQHGAGGAGRRPCAFRHAGRRRRHRRHLQHEPGQAHGGLESDHEPAASPVSGCGRRAAPSAGRGRGGRARDAAWGRPPDLASQPRSGHARP